MKLFLDTEWADDAGRELVSLALVSAEAQNVFYAERQPLPGDPSDFVSWVVYPRLCRGGCALPDREFTSALRAFVQQAASPVVCYDNARDLALLELALGGFGEALPADQKPVIFTIRKLSGRRYEDAIATVFRTNPSANVGRHNALVDAFAMRQAYAWWDTGTIPL